MKIEPFSISIPLSPTFDQLSDTFLMGRQCEVYGLPGIEDGTKCEIVAFSADNVNCETSACVRLRLMVDTEDVSQALQNDAKSNKAGEA